MLMSTADYADKDVAPIDFLDGQSIGHFGPLFHWPPIVFRALFLLFTSHRSRGGHALESSNYKRNRRSKLFRKAWSYFSLFLWAGL